MCFAPQRRTIFQTCNCQKWVFNILTWNVLRATAACNFSTFQLQKVVQHAGSLHILTWKCASRHSGVQFFKLATSHFDLEMRFPPHARAIFRTCNFQKWSEPVSFLTCVSRHSGVQFFKLPTSKSGPNPSVF